MKKGLFIILLLSLIFSIDVGAKITAMRGKVKESYNFWLYEPEITCTVDTTTKAEPSVWDILPEPQPIVASDYDFHNICDTVTQPTVDPNSRPLIIFLHGQSLCGTNLDRVMRYGTMAALKGGRKIDAFIVAPQNPGGPWKPAKIAKIMDWAIENYPIDTTRIYVLGMSLGGYGTIDFVATYPERVAAAMALCGGGTVKDYSGLNKVPLWIIHGTADRAVSVRESRKVVDAMKSAGKTPLLRYDEWAGVNHGRLARLFYLSDTYTWLMSHSLLDSPRQVNKQIVITNSTLNNAYSDLKLKKSTKKKSYKRKKKRK